MMLLKSNPEYRKMSKKQKKAIHKMLDEFTDFRTSFVRSKEIEKELFTMLFPSKEQQIDGHKTNQKPKFMKLITNKLFQYWTKKKNR